MQLQPFCQGFCELHLRSSGSCPVNVFQEMLRNEDQAGGCRCPGTYTKFFCQCRGVPRCGTLEPNRDGLP